MVEETERDPDKQIVADAKKYFALCEEGDADARAKRLDDLEFLDGQQWDEPVLQKRKQLGRPALVVNRMDQFVQHVTNSIRQNRIAARVFPVDDVGDPDTADVIQGYLRHIEADSDGDLAYGTGAFYAVSSGVGYWILRTKYVSPYSFDTEITIDRISNPFQIHLDPNHRHPSGKDAKYGFKITTLSKDEYEREFPDSELAQSSDWETYRSGSGDWIDTDNNVRIAEYYTIECNPDTLVRLKDGSARLKSELKENEKSQIQKDPKTKKDVERETSIETVKWYKVNSCEVLARTVWPTSPDYVSLPIVKVIGNELDIDGRNVLKGIIRNLKDAQRQYNYMLSAQTEAIDSAKGQIIVADGQMEGHEEEWMDAANRKILTVTGKSADSSPAKDPFRLQPNASIPAMTEARLMAADDLKALTGLYDAALGAQSNETSGRAINSRQAQSDIANFHFTGNLVRSVNHSAKLIIGAIPSVIDTPRAIRMIGEDDRQKVIKVNQHLGAKDATANPDDKVIKMGGDGVGKYDVVCEAGPSPATQKEERAIRMTEIVKVAPQLMNIAPDLILKDLGASHELVERVKKSLPPELQDKEDGKKPDPEQMQAQLAQAHQAIQQLQAELQKASNPLEVEQLRQQGQIQQKQIDGQLQEQKMQHEKDIASAKFEHELQLRKIDTQAKMSGEVMKHDTTEAVAEHSAEAQMALEIYKTEAMLKAKQIDRDAAEQQQEASEDVATAKSLNGGN